MKLETSNNFLEVHGSFSTTEFTIDDSAIAFELFIMQTLAELGWYMTE